MVCCYAYVERSRKEVVAMEVTYVESPAEECKHILMELGFSAHHAGYKQLKYGIPRFILDDQQYLASELYPDIAHALNYSDGDAVERSIGRSICHAWKYGNKSVWEQYFPNSKKPPSNKLFIATIAEYVK